MRRSLFNLLTLLSLLLLLVAVALWARLGSRSDEIVIRTAPSYTWWPRTKWVVVWPYDGWVISFYQKVRPHVDGLPAPWREDVPLEFKRLEPPTVPTSRKMGEAEYAAYQAERSVAYRAEPLMRWRSRPRAVVPAGPPPLLTMPTVWTALGFQTYAPNNWILNDVAYPGAYHDVRIGVPHYIVMCVAGALPALWAWRWIRAYLTRRRVGLCPACGYDLRGSVERCPECGRDVTEEEAQRAGWTRPDVATKPPTGSARPWGQRPRRRWEWPAFAAIVVMLSLTLWRGSAERPRPRSPDERAIRRELALKINDVEREVARLRAAGDVGAAERMEAELRRVRGPTTAGVGSDLPLVSVVGLYVGERPPGSPTVATGGTRPVGAAAVEVRTTGRPVVLVLCAYEPVKWDLAVTAGARLQKVILAGYYAQQVVGVPDGVPVVDQSNQGRSQRWFHAHSRTDNDYPRMMRTAQELAGHPVATFQGRYAYDGRPFIVGPGDADWEAQRVLADLEPLHLAATAVERENVIRALGSLRFEALWWTRFRQGGHFPSVAVATFDITGPLSNTIRATDSRVEQIAADRANSTYFGAAGNSVFGLDVSRPFAGPFTLPGMPRSFGPTTAIAFDARRRQLMAATDLGPFTTLYTFSPETGRWSPGAPYGPAIGWRRWRIRRRTTASTG